MDGCVSQWALGRQGCSWPMDGGWRAGAELQAISGEMGLFLICSWDYGQLPRHMLTFLKEPSLALGSTWVSQSSTWIPKLQERHFFHRWLPNYCCYGGIWLQHILFHHLINLFKYSLCSLSNILYLTVNRCYISAIRFISEYFSYTFLLLYTIISFKNLIFNCLASI